MGVYQIDPSTVRDITPEVMGPDGRMRILPAAYWARTTVPERAVFGHQHGIYGFPTVELVEHLRAVIGGRSAIEIGAGHGVLAEALDIPATDNFMQQQPKYRQILARAGQPPVRYGPNVINCDANTAVREYAPEVVIASWVTHRYDPQRHEAGGNEAGPDEDDIIDNCCEYVFIGSSGVHLGKRIWRRLHRVESPPFLFSRQGDGSRDFIATWWGLRFVAG